MTTELTLFSFSAQGGPVNSLPVVSEFTSFTFIWEPYARDLWFTFITTGVYYLFWFYIILFYYVQTGFAFVWITTHSVFRDLDDAQEFAYILTKITLSVVTMVSKKMSSNWLYNTLRDINLHFFLLKISKLTSILWYEKFYYQDSYILAIKMTFMERRFRKWTSLCDIKKF